MSKNITNYIPAPTRPIRIVSPQDCLARKRLEIIKKIYVKTGKGEMK